MSLIVPILKPVISSPLSGLKESLISCWELDETSGTTAYDSYATKHGTLVNSPTIGQTGKINNCYYFNNTAGKYIDINAMTITGFPFSLSLWYNISSTTAKVLFTSNDSTKYYGLSVSMDGTVIVINYGNGVGTTTSSRKSYNYNTTSSINTWYHLVITSTGFAQANNKVYKNGVELTYSANSGGGTSVSWASGVTRFPKNWNSTSAPMYGYIDQVATWGKVLSSTEIAALYNSGNGFAYTNWT